MPCAHAGCAGGLGSGHDTHDRDRPAAPGGRLPGRRQRCAPRRAHRLGTARGRGRARDEPPRLRLRGGRRGPRAHHGQQPRRVRRPADRAAGPARRVGARPVHQAVRPHHPGSPPAGAGGCGRDGSPQRRRGCRPGRGRRGDPHGLLQPGLTFDGGVRGADGWRTSMVPALLEHHRRTGGELPRPGRTLRLRGRRGHARHDAAGFGAAATSTSGRCPSAGVWGSRSTPATPSSGGSSPSASVLREDGRHRSVHSCAPRRSGP
jgi:hypothetical protein